MEREYYNGFLPDFYLNPYVRPLNKFNWDA